MPFDPNDWVETLVAESSAASASLEIPKAMLDSVFTDLKPLNGYGLGGNIVINVPTVSKANVTDIGNGSLGTPADIAESSVTVSISTKASNARKIPGFDEVKSNYRIAEQLIQPMLEEVLDYVDNDLASLVTSTNFTAAATITGGADTLTRAQCATARANLRAKGVDFSKGEVSLVIPPVVYGNILGGTEFTNEANVGLRMSESANMLGVLMNIFGANVKEDYYLPVISTNLYACGMFHKNAIAIRTLAPKPLVTGNYVSTLVQPKPGIWMTVATWFEPKDQANYMQVSCMYGKSVIRPDMGQYIQTV